jgi:hypothetical protein
LPAAQSAFFEKVASSDPDRKQAIMAKGILNRRELRKQADEADNAETSAVVETDGKGAPKKRKAKAATAPKVRKPRAKKAPARMRARWGIFDGMMKQVAIFDYNQRALADAKLADLREKKKTPHFIQIVKEAMAEPAPAEPTAES